MFKLKRVMGSFLIVLLLLLSVACGDKNEKQADASAVPAVASPAGSGAPTSSANPHGSHWSYEGELGPSHWAELDKANTACANGSEQSPINIDIAQVKPNAALEKIKLQYSPTAFVVVNNGHTIQANAAADPVNTMTIEGKTYRLVQFHFHLPSEHQFNGKSYDMELHLVHKSEQGELAVLGVMLKVGKEQASLAEVWAKMPKTENLEGVSLEKPVDLEGLLPAERSTFRYNGSLTTPPCSQSVKWVVLEQPVEISPSQYDAFKAIFPHNARPVQELKGRQVESDQKQQK